MSYILGIDVGLTSVGFAGVNHQLEKILFCGAHIFDVGENPKNGASLAAPRREKRSLRRVHSRKAQRKKQVRALLFRHGFKNVDAIDQSWIQPKQLSPWDLRKEALQRKLSDDEFARVLFHIAKHRGFQSNKKNGHKEESAEGKKLLAGAANLKEKAHKAGENTIAAYLAQQPKQRNGEGDYSCTILRNSLRIEVSLIFEAQQKFGNSLATPGLLKEYAGSGKPNDRYTLEGDGIAFYQRPLRSSEHLVGMCALETGEKRAPKNAYTTELFILWSKLNTLCIRDSRGHERSLSDTEKKTLFALVHENKNGVTYKQTRNCLNLLDHERFNIYYRSPQSEMGAWDTIRDYNEKSVFISLPGYHALRDALNTENKEYWQNWVYKKRETLDDIARILSFHDDKRQVEHLLSNLSLSEQEIERLCLSTHFSGTVNLSLKAIHKTLPFLVEGLTYGQACKKAGYQKKHKNKQGRKFVPPFEELGNPILNRTLSETRKIANACIREFGLPEMIILELHRELFWSFDQRKKNAREKEKREKTRHDDRLKISEILEVPMESLLGEDFLKYDLWTEQEGICPYSGFYISPDILRDKGATEIDHILPFSRSWDHSYMNKILCFSDENQKKGARTPYEYLGGTSHLERLEALAKKLPYKKAERLLMINYHNREKNWKEKALNDTSNMANLIKNHIEYALDLGKGSHVQTRNGAMIAFLRNAWGFPNKVRKNDTFHAVSAIVLACSTPENIQKLADWSKYETIRLNPWDFRAPPRPWEGFHGDVTRAVSAVFVSRKPVRKVTGSAHLDTIRSIRQSDGAAIQRIKLKSLKLINLERLVDKRRNIKLYHLLKERLITHDNNPRKAFAEPVFMPVNDPSKTPPRIESVRIVTSEKCGLKINGGLVSNGDIIRVDVFRSDHKYRVVPIYAHHFSRNVLPNKAIVSFKDESDWLTMNDEDFLFSLYRNDLIRIESKKEAFFAYFVRVNRGTGSISVRTHDSNPEFGKDGVREGVGIQNLVNFEKYTVDYFGRKNRVKKEKRIGTQKNSSQSQL